jgi:tRNA pseudouridine synthase 10
MSGEKEPVAVESAGLPNGLVSHGNSKTRRVYETARSLHTGAVKDLLSLGVCERCIFRLVSVEAFDSDISSVSTSTLRSWLKSGDDETSASESSCSTICIVCLGILQFVFSDVKKELVKSDSSSDYVARITDLVKQDRHEFDSFGLEVSVPSTIMENERALLSYLKGKYSTEVWLQRDKISVKDALKVLLLDQLKASLGAESDSSSFHIRLTYTKASDEAQGASETTHESKRRKTDAENGSNCISENSFEKVYEPCIFSVHCNRMPIFFSGRYFKVSHCFHVLGAVYCICNLHFCVNCSLVTNEFADDRADL